MKGKDGSDATATERYQLAIMEIDSLRETIEEMELKITDKEAEIEWLENLVFEMQKVVRQNGNIHSVLMQNIP